MDLTPLTSATAPSVTLVALTIDELDLGGVPAARRDLVAAVFQRELTRLVTERAPRAATGAHDRAATVVGARPDGNPLLFGAALARSVYAALDREPR